MRPLLLIAALCAVLPASAAASADTLTTYHRTGGFAGRDDRVRVYTDRQVRIRSRGERTRRIRISPARMRKLRAALDAAKFDQPFTQGPTGCADCFDFALRYKGSSVRFEQASEPTRFDGVLRLITPLVDG